MAIAGDRNCFAPLCGYPAFHPEAIMAQPLALTDSQYSAVVAACEPLLPVDRGAFLVALANVLRDEPQPLGDGTVARAIRSLQREFRQPPAVTEQEPRSRRVVGEPLA
jgi:hypothetical protein